MIENEDNLRFAYSMVKQEIIRFVRAYFPERRAHILFEVMNGLWNCSFKIAKTKHEL